MYTKRRSFHITLRSNHHHHAGLAAVTIGTETVRNERLPKYDHKLLINIGVIMNDPSHLERLIQTTRLRFDRIFDLRLIDNAELHDKRTNFLADCMLYQFIVWTTQSESTITAYTSQ